MKIASVNWKRKAGGGAVLIAFEINFAIWGMIACTAIEAVQYLN